MELLLEMYQCVCQTRVVYVCVTSSLSRPTAEISRPSPPYSYRTPPLVDYLYKSKTSTCSNVYCLEIEEQTNADSYSPSNILQNAI